MEKVYGGHFVIKEKIGAGSFGEIYLGEDTKSHKQVALKIEKLKTQSAQLEAEYRIYKNLSPSVNIADLYFYGIEIKTCAMVMERLGKSLEVLKNENGGTLSLKTVLMLADQMISAVEFLHKKNYIHGDIKPDNFVMGLNNKSNQVYILDFGLARYYINYDTLKHIPYQERVPFSGTARYASAGSLRGIEQSRRDDMEGLAYVWLYLLKGKLPWMFVDAPNQNAKYLKISTMKTTMKPKDLFADFPPEFALYLTEIRKMKFAEEPNYEKYKKMFRNIFVNLGFKYDYVYDWTNDTETLNRQKSLTNLNEFGNNNGNNLNNNKGCGIKRRESVKTASSLSREVKLNATHSSSGNKNNNVSTKSSVNNNNNNTNNICVNDNNNINDNNLNVLSKNSVNNINVNISTKLNSSKSSVNNVNVSPGNENDQNITTDNNEIEVEQNIDLLMTAGTSKRKQQSANFDRSKDSPSPPKEMRLNEFPRGAGSKKISNRIPSNIKINNNLIRSTSNLNASNRSSSNIRLNHVSSSNISCKIRNNNGNRTPRRFEGPKSNKNNINNINNSNNNVNNNINNNDNNDNNNVNNNNNNNENINNTNNDNNSNNNGNDGDNINANNNDNNDNNNNNVIVNKNNINSMNIIINKNGIKENSIPVAELDEDNNEENGEKNTGQPLNSPRCKRLSQRSMPTLIIKNQRKRTSSKL